MNMPLTSKTLIKTIIITLCISHTSLSCASPQSELVSSASDETKTTSNCTANSLLKSKTLIDYIFQDIFNTYPHTGGGGVTSIKEISTNTFEIYIAQEEKIDVILYELKIDEDCSVEQLKKNESTINFG